MRTRILFTLICSLSLIGLSLVFRVSNKNDASQLVAVPQNTVPKDIIILGETNEPVNTVSTTPLSDIDLISRQLFSEYARISKNGQGTPSILQGLGNKYADNILSHGADNPSETISGKDLAAVKDSVAAFSQYEKQMTALRAKYEVAAKNLSKHEQVSDNLDDPASQRFFGAAGNLYEQAASEFKLVYVPASLLPTHIAIVNNYLSSAEMMKGLSQTSEDPLKVYAIVKKQIENQQQEEELFKDMQLSLKKSAQSL